MIIYYTGTGNSRFAAGYISKCLQKLNNGRGETVTGEMAAGGTAADKRDVQGKVHRSDKRDLEGR